MKSMRKTGLVLALGMLFCTADLVAQGYEIGIRIRGMANDTLLLGYHFADKKFIADTAILDDRGRGVFTGEKPLAGGIYLVVLPEKNYFEILVTANQRFSIETSKENLVDDLHFSSSPENDAFLQYEERMSGFQARAGQIQQKLRALPQGSDSVQFYREALNEVNQEVRNYWEEVIRQDPESLLAKIVRAMIPPEIPDFDIPPDCPNPDSLQMVLAYAFQRDHFFDGFAWADSSLLRTPILYNKLQQYVNQLLIQHPDSLIGPITRVIEESKANPSVFQYVTVYMLNHFMQSNIMGQDKVFVEIARRYYLSGEAFWASEEFLTNLRENVEKIVPNLIGATAHDLIMEDPSGEWHSLAQVRADYTVLYFWEPDCGHCKVSTPKLWDLYQKWRGKGLEVFAVYTQDNRQEWTDYLNEKGYDWINVYDPTNQSFFRFYYNVISTPTIYLLDRDKKIIAKRISVESLTEMVDRLMTGGRI